MTITERPATAQRMAESRKKMNEQIRQKRRIHKKSESERLTANIKSRNNQPKIEPWEFTEEDFMIY